MLRDFAVKRILGGLNWKLRRHKWHERVIVDRLVDDIKAHAPDHVALTGDVVNLSAHAEFLQAAAWLQSFGPPDWISLVPGNHDAYVPVAWEKGLVNFAPYMTGSMAIDQPLTTAHNAQPFPFVRFKGNLALIGLTSGEPQGLGKASGSLGAVQLRHLGPLLRNLRLKGCYRTVLIHHPPIPGETPPRKALLDADAFARIVAEEGAELILHGHIHRNTRNVIESAAGPVPVIGVASASMAAAGKRQSASWNLFEISRSGGRWSTSMTQRTYDAAAAQFATIQQISLPL